MQLIQDYHIEIKRAITIVNVRSLNRATKKGKQETYTRRLKKIKRIYYIP